MKRNGRMVRGNWVVPVSVPLMHSSAAKLAISIARKMGALIFLVPEDIVDVRPRLVSCGCQLIDAYVF